MSPVAMETPSRVEITVDSPPSASLSNCVVSLTPADAFASGSVACAPVAMASGTIPRIARRLNGVRHLQNYKTSIVSVRAVSMMFVLPPLQPTYDLAPTGITPNELLEWGRSMIGGDVSDMLDI